MNNKEIEEEIKAAQINQALGLYIFIFGIIIVIAMAFTETFVQQMTDLTAGSLLVIIGLGMIWKARITLKKMKTANGK